MSKEIQRKIKRLVKKSASDVLQIRRHIHAHPELSYKEKNTNAYIRTWLDEAGIKYKSGYCKYGIVAEVKGGKSGGITYLRGDMDALPIVEQNKVAYKSKFDGIMHACGHDVHSTCVLGAAMVLNELKENLPGTYRFLFQPGEEQLPGGASIMIKEGAIKNVKSAKIFAQHVHPPLEAGKVGFYPGEYMASADEIFVEIIGKGGHAALPQDLVDPIITTAHVLTAVQAVISRNSDPKVPSVLSFGKIESDGGATNIIPDRVWLRGTLRTMDEDNRYRLHKHIRSTIQQVAKGFGATAKVKIKVGYPTLVNDVELTNSAMENARTYLGKDNVVLLDKRMTAEDFSYYSQMMPACFYRLGTGNAQRGITSGVHTPTFDIDESALNVGVGLMAYLAVCNNSIK
ncbi:MAG: amidohydrolase [Saprospiraceae bacterium]|nr:amidohydrolase [Saprospiraceae bacterium]